MKSNELPAPRKVGSEENARTEAAPSRPCPSCSMNRINVLVAGEGGGLHTEPNCPRCDDLPEEVVEAYLRNPVPDRPQVPNRPAPPSLKPPAERPTACPDCGGKRHWCFDDKWDPMCFACVTAPIGAAPESRKAVG